MTAREPSLSATMAMAHAQPTLTELSGTMRGALIVGLRAVEGWRTSSLSSGSARPRYTHRLTHISSPSTDHVRVHRPARALLITHTVTVPATVPLPSTSHPEPRHQLSPPFLPFPLPLPTSVSPRSSHPPPSIASIPSTASMPLLRCAVRFCLVLVLLLSAPCCWAQLSVTVTFPNSQVTQGVAGSGWLIDLNLAATTPSANSLLAPPAFVGSFRNGAGTPFTPVHSPGVDPAALGLVVLLSTTPNNGATLFGPSTNLAGLFQVNAPAVSSTGLSQFRVVWWVGSTSFGEGVGSTLTAFVVNGTAPALLSTAPAFTPGLISNVAVVAFNISGPTSLTASSSTFTGNSTANPSAVNVAVLTPTPGDVLGFGAANFVIDLRAVTTDPSFNPLLSAGAGYLPLYANTSDPTMFRPGFMTAAPGVVVLMNTSTLGTGATTNLAGLFQINAINTLSTATGGALNEIWMDWQAGKASFGSGPCRLIVFILNTTAPLVVTDVTPGQLGLISNVVTVDFFLSAAPAAAVLGDPSFTGFHGGAPFQVHGIPGAVFNLLTAPSLQLNALFTFIDQGEAMGAAEMREHLAAAAARRASAGLPLPRTQPWSHPGTYLSQMGVKLGALQLLLRAGRYSHGVACVTLVDANAARNLTVGETVRFGDASLTWLSGWVVEVHHSLLSFRAVNSDGFFNLEQAQLLHPDAGEQLDGLLGQSADPAWKASQGHEWEEHLMMDYLVLDAEHPTQQPLLSDDFRANKFVRAT